MSSPIHQDGPTQEGHRIDCRPTPIGPSVHLGQQASDRSHQAHGLAKRYPRRPPVCKIPLVNPSDKQIRSESPAKFKAADQGHLPRTSGKPARAWPFQYAWKLLIGGRCLIGKFPLLGSVPGKRVIEDQFRVHS